LSHSGASDNPYLYTGQQFDALTGLYSLRARYYDPALGRFLSRDPAEPLKPVSAHGQRGVSWIGGGRRFIAGGGVSTGRCALFQPSG